LQAVRTAIQATVPQNASTVCSGSTPNGAQVRGCYEPSNVLISQYNIPQHGNTSAVPAQLKHTLLLLCNTTAAKVAGVSGPPPKLPLPVQATSSLTAIVPNATSDIATAKDLCAAAKVGDVSSHLSPMEWLFTYV
jgi:hypothetical protein